MNSKKKISKFEMWLFDHKIISAVILSSVMTGYLLIGAPGAKYVPIMSGTLMEGARDIATGGMGDVLFRFVTYAAILSLLFWWDQWKTFRKSKEKKK